MPEISRFFGIVIAMYFNDHESPHFHAHYAGQQAIFDIQSAKIIHGQLPKRAIRLICEWIELHRDELLINWRRARQHQQLYRIDPLE